MTESVTIGKRQFFLRDLTIKRTCLAFISNLPTDPEHPLVVKVQEMTRTLDQSAKMWALLDEIADQVDWHGRKLDAQAWKHIFSASLTRQDVVPNLDNTGFVVLGASTSKMTKREMSELIELISCFGAEHEVKFGERMEA